MRVPRWIAVVSFCTCGAGCGQEGIATLLPAVQTADLLGVVRQPLKCAPGWFVETLHTPLAEPDGAGREASLSLRVTDDAGATVVLYAEGHMPVTWETDAEGASSRPLPDACLASQPQQTTLARSDDRAALELALRLAGQGAQRAANLGRTRADVAAGIPWRVELPGWEFKEEVHLWFQKFSPPNKWPRTPYDHTATYTYVFKRPRDSSEPWTVHQTAVRCNHGACPSQEDMKRYAVCDGMPVTVDGYSVRGECPGYWGVSHLCNDDTALQVSQARGYPSDVCHRTGRFNRPSCDVHE